MAHEYSFLVIKYPKAGTAAEALNVLKEMSDDDLVKLRDAVAITKTEKGKVKIHQTKDDTIGKGFVKGGVIGALFALLFGPVGWIAMGAAAGGLFASFDRGIKNKLLKELGQDMTPSESAVAILVEHANWSLAVERMRSYGFGGTVVISEIVAEDTAEVERLLADPKTEPVPEEIEIPAPAAVAAAPVVAAAAAPALAEPDIFRETAPMSIAEIEGIGSVDAEKLAAAGIKTTADLLSNGAKPSGRDQLAKTTGIGTKQILEWVNHVDLMRIPGVGPQYSDLLEAAGVDSPAELSHRNAKNLEDTFQSVVAARPGIVNRIPGEAQITGWIDDASKLEAVVEH